MPSVNLNISQQGAMIDVLIEVSQQRKLAMQSAGLIAPIAVPCRLLIDTGASSTCLDSWIFKSLNINPIGTVEMHTPSTSVNNAHRCNQYDICLIVPHQAINRYFHTIPALESEFSHQGIDGLLGRDILESCLFIYNGELGIYTLSF